MESKIANFYKDKNVFITGVSGFLGKAILEKLLRSCPNVGMIYVLIRPKFGIDAKTRLKTILQNPIFNVLKASQPNIFSKVFPIVGDICQENLGVSESDRDQLIRSLHVVIHSAASVKFNEPIKQAMNINYYGTQRVLDLCSQIHQLASFVHISTAYANCDLSRVNEEILFPEEDPEIVSCMSDDLADQLTPLIIKDKPNTYTHTKALTEALLLKYQGQFPIACVRPSIIGATWQEPQPGFVDGLGGLTGVMAATGKGLLVALNCDGENVSDIIPLDVVANLIIVAAWNAASSNKRDELTVFNCCSGSLNPLTMNAIRKHGLAAFDQVPPDNVFRYPGLWFTKNFHCFLLLNAIFSLIPCLFMDVLSTCKGGKARMVTTFRKMMSSMSAYAYFHMRQWDFETNNMKRLREKLSDVDKNTFFWNIEDMSWKQYIFNYNLGIKKFIFKEDFANLMSSKNHFNRVYWMTIFTRILGLCGIGVTLLNLVKF